MFLGLTEFSRRAPSHMREARRVSALAQTNQTPYNFRENFSVAAFSLSPYARRLCSCCRSNKESYARVRKICGATQRFGLGTASPDSFARHAHFSNFSSSLHPAIPRQG